MSVQFLTISESLRHHTITLSDSFWNYARDIGKGNHSKGIRIALAEYYEQERRKDSPKLARRMDGVHE